MINPKDVGKRIRTIRKETLGLSMTDFATRIDNKAKSGTVSNWETGKNLPNNERIKRIADLGNVSVNELLHGPLIDQIRGALNQYLYLTDRLPFNGLENEDEIVNYFVEKYKDMDYFDPELFVKEFKEEWRYQERDINSSDAKSKITKVTINAGKLAISFDFDDYDVSLQYKFSLKEQNDSITKALGATRTLDVISEDFFPDKTQVDNKLHSLPSEISIQEIIYHDFEPVAFDLEGYKFNGFHSVKTIAIDIMLRRYLKEKGFDFPISIAIYGMTGGLDSVLTING